MPSTPSVDDAPVTEGPLSSSAVMSADTSAKHIDTMPCTCTQAKASPNQNQSVAIGHTKKKAHARDGTHLITIHKLRRDCVPAGVHAQPEAVSSARQDELLVAMRTEQ